MIIFPFDSMISKYGIYLPIGRVSCREQKLQGSTGIHKCVSAAFTWSFTLLGIDVTKLFDAHAFKTNLEIY